MILLDTHAVLWIHTGQKRVKKILGSSTGLYVSPATMLELHFLLEIGRLKLRPGTTIEELLDDDRWLVDDPPSAAWFERAATEDWTRDPFDRLLVAHARLRGWKLATADEVLLERLAPSESVEL